LEGRRYFGRDTCIRVAAIFRGDAVDALAAALIAGELSTQRTERSGWVVLPSC
jgi:hypothetical protein